MTASRRRLKEAWFYFWAMPQRVSSWMRVSDAMTAHDWPESQRCLEASFAGLGFPVPSRDAIPKMNLAAATISYWMNHPDRALKALEVAIDQVKTGRIRDLSEASYVARYCFELAEFCAGRLSAYSASFLEQAARAQMLIVPFNWRRVRGDYRRLFPLTNAPH